jgi:tRNA pseudouridine38-40 synthase
MQRYFLEVAYKGTNYSGFQVQQNANSIQAEVENALAILFRQQFSLTGSSRTDTGVHALQNFFHFDTDADLTKKKLYNLNSILPPDIVAKNFYRVDNAAHCRFDAISREYKYFLYNKKNPFLQKTAYYFPFKIDFEILKQAARIIAENEDFTSFSKRKTQVKNFICNIQHSQWSQEKDQLVYTVIANRFLRGMVRGLVGSMLKAATGAISIQQFDQIFDKKNCADADFSAPAHGLFLVSVNYKDGMLNNIIE